MTTQILDINKVKQLLDNEDIYEDDDGNKLQTIYLGSILNLTPSGKMYMPFACSNLSPCTRCKGTGVIKNKHGKKKKHEKVMRKLGLAWQATEHAKLNMNVIRKLQKQRDWWDTTIQCPECNGEGSLEARLDQDWWEQLEIELNEINAWAHESNDDGCDILISREAIEVNDDGTR